jgi:hypothetical protein
MAPKDAKKRMKAEQNKKHKLQPTINPAPHITISNCAPSLQCNKPIGPSALIIV